MTFEKLTIENLSPWQSLFTLQLRVTMDSIRNSCNVYWLFPHSFFVSSEEGDLYEATGEDADIQN